MSTQVMVVAIKSGKKQYCGGGKGRCCTPGTFDMICVMIEVVWIVVSVKMGPVK